MRAKLKSALHLAVCQQIVFLAGCSGRAIHKAAFAIPRTGAQTTFVGTLKSGSRACSQVLVQQRLMHQPAFLSLRSKIQDGGKPAPPPTGAVEILEEPRLLKKTLNVPVRVFSWTQGEDGVPFTEIIDVRSPAEYAEDHIPSAINLPCLDNEQHHAVGLLYASSPFEARKVGSAHVCRNVAAMLETHFRSKGKDYRPLIYCWRGGQRSGSVALILAEVGFRTSVLEGGYKHYRSRVQTGLKTLPAQFAGKFCLLSGPTGSCKTRLLKRLAYHGEQVLDLEEFAHHRGSVLGGHLEPQPSQKGFDSAVFRALSVMDPARPVWVEAESSNIGRVQVPPVLFEEMRKAPRFQVDMPIDQRVTATLGEYHDLTLHPEKLKKLLSPLKGHTDGGIFEEWMDLIDKKAWPAFVQMLLETHYDPSYMRSQKVHAQKYKPVSVKVVLNSLNETDIDDGVAFCKASQEMGQMLAWKGMEGQEGPLH